MDKSKNFKLACKYMSHFLTFLALSLDELAASLA